MSNKKKNHIQTSTSASTINQNVNCSNNKSSLKKSNDFNQNQISKSKTPHQHRLNRSHSAFLKGIKDLNNKAFISSINLDIPATCKCQKFCNTNCKFISI